MPTGPTSAARSRPGIGLSLEALVGRASKLPRIELRRPPSAIGANTIHAMQSGTVLGYIGLVSGLLTALRGELLERSPADSRVTVIATGGYTHSRGCATCRGSTPSSRT